MWSVRDNVSMLYIRWVSDMFITWTLKHLQLQTFTVILAWSYYILVTSAAVQKLKIYSVQRLHVQLNRTWESNNGEIIYNSLTLALFLMFFYFSSSVIYYPNLVHAAEGDHTTGKKLPPHTHLGPSFLQQLQWLATASRRQEQIGWGTHMVKPSAQSRQTTAVDFF